MVPLTEEEIKAIQHRWNHIEDTNYFRVALKMDRPDSPEKQILIPHLNTLKNHAVLEIGPGRNPLHNLFPCGEYHAARGIFPRDGLSVLRTKSDASAVVISFGVLDDDILCPGENHGLNLRYIEELVGEIKRVMNPFAIMCGTHVMKYMGKPDIALDNNRQPEFGGIYLRDSNFSVK